MRNHFNIIRSIGIIFFAAGFFLAIVTFPEFLSRLDEDSYSYGRSIWENGLGAVLLLGVGMLIIGMGGLLKVKWFPIAGTAALIACLVLFSWFVVIVIWPDVRPKSLHFAIGLSITFYAVIISLILLFNNKYFREALTEESEREDSDDRILDA